jgi:hypothetical protein
VDRKWWAWLDARRLVLIVTLAAVFAMAARVPIDHDGWWHLASGRYIVERGAIPRSDPFSHTRADATWIDNGWLAQISLFLAYRWLGYVGLGLWVALGATAATALLWPQMKGGSFLRAFILILAAAVSGPVWTMRPHLVTYVLTAALGLLLYRWRRGESKVLWLVPPLFVLWVNLHAGYVLGLGVLGLTVVGEGMDRLRGEGGAPPWDRIARLIGVGVSGLLLVPLNPYGPRMWRYPFYNAGQEVARRFIAEWASPDFHRAVSQPFALMLLLTLLATGLSRRRGRWSELLPVTVFAYLTLRSQRAMGLFAVVTVPVLSRYMASLLTPVMERWRVSRLRRPTTPRRALLNGTLALLIVGAAALKAGAVWREPATKRAVQKFGFPVEASDWLAERHPPGELYNPYNWGGYLIWHLPDYPVFVDGRADMYGDPFLLKYIELASASSGWEEALVSRDVCTALVTLDGPLAEAMDGSPNWRRIYEDQVSAIYLRSDLSCAWDERSKFSRPSYLRH